MREKSISPILLSAVAGTLALMVSMFASAAGVLEEVTVTAQKREQSVQDVGIAITAFSGEQIEKLGYTNSTDIVAMMPGVQVNKTTGPSNYSFSIRGVTQADFADHQESPISVYVDEVYVSQTSAVGFSLFDVERVEVLRGPQGTLFGRNSTGGLVHYITKKPTEKFEAYVSGMYASENERRLEAGIGGALGESVSGRISGTWGAIDPWIKNDAGPDGRDYENYAVRGQLLFSIGESADLLISARQGQMTSDTPFFFQWDTAIGYDPANGFLPVAVPGPDAYGYEDTDGDNYRGAWDAFGGFETETSGITSTLNWAIGEANLTWIADFQNVEKNYIGDTDSGPERSGGTGGPLHFANYADVDQWSQELRLNGDWDSGRWIIGAYYLDIAGYYVSASEFAGGPVAAVVPGFPPIPYSTNLVYDNNKDSWALFAQTEYDLTDQLTLIAGARYTKDNTDFDYVNFLVFGQTSSGLDIKNVSVADASIPPFLTIVGTDSEGLVSGKLQLDWKPSDDLLVYGSWNRGIKGGGFNAPIAPDLDPGQETFDSETLDAFEVGAKATIFDGGGRFNAAAFYYDYKDYQVFQLIPGITSRIFNKPATIQGLEADLVFYPGEGWDIMLGAAYVDAEVEDIPRFDGSLVNTRPPLIPEFTASVLVRYEFEVLGGHVALQADANYRSNQYFDIQNQPVLKESGYSLANVRATYRSSDDSWSVTAFVDNITDEEVRVMAYTLPGGPPAFLPNTALADYGRPRWVGISFKYNWSAD